MCDLRFRAGEHHTRRQESIRRFAEYDEQPLHGCQIFFGQRDFGPGKTMENGRIFSQGSSPTNMHFHAKDWRGRFLPARSSSR